MTVIGYAGRFFVDGKDRYHIISIVPNTDEDGRSAAALSNRSNFSKTDRRSQPELMASVTGCRAHRLIVRTEARLARRSDDPDAQGGSPTLRSIRQKQDRAHVEAQAGFKSCRPDMINEQPVALACGGLFLFEYQCFAVRLPGANDGSDGWRLFADCQREWHNALSNHKFSGFKSRRHLRECAMAKKVRGRWGTRPIAVSSLKRCHNRQGARSTRARPNLGLEWEQADAKGRS